MDRLREEERASAQQYLRIENCFEIEKIFFYMTLLTIYVLVGVVLSESLGGKPFCALKSAIMRYEI